MARLTESIVEDAALAWLEALGYAVLHGPDIAAGELGAERSDPNYRDVVLEGRLRQALVRLNPDLPHEALEDAYRKLTRSDAPSLVERNRARAPDAGRWGHGRVPPQGRLDCRGTGPGHRLRHTGQQRLAGRQSVHRVGGTADAPARCGAVRQRSPTGGDRTQEPCRRERDDLVALISSFRPTRRRSPHSSPLTRRWSSPMACRRASARSARARNGSSLGARSPGARTHPRSCPSCKWCWRAYSRSAASSTCCGTSSCSRIDGWRQTHQEDGGLPPVPRGERGGGGNPACGRGGRGRPGGRAAGALRGGATARWRPWRPARWRGLAHAGFRQESDDGFLCGPRDPASGDGEPDDRGAHRPQRPRRPAFRHVRALP